jgi:hypothetical protein
MPKEASMKIEEILSKEPVPTFDDALHLHMHGVIRRDEATEYFRLYPNPASRTSYFLIAQNDVVGEADQWTAEEMTAAGYKGSKVYSLKVKRGALAQFVSITVGKLGETIAGEIFDNPRCGPVETCPSKRCCQYIEGSTCWCTTSSNIARRQCCGGKGGKHPHED